MEYGCKERERQSFCLFLVFPCISLHFPAFPYISLPLSRALKYGKHSLLLQAETCDEAQNKKRNYKQNKNKMGYFIITDPNWANGTVFQSV